MIALKYLKMTTSRLMCTLELPPGVDLYIHFETTFSEESKIVLALERTKGFIVFRSGDAQTLDAFNVSTRPRFLRNQSKALSKAASTHVSSTTTESTASKRSFFCRQLRLSTPKE